IKDLAPEHREPVRRAIEEFIFNGFNRLPRATDRAMALEFVRPPRGWKPILRSWLDRGAAQDGGITDAVFVRYMLGRRALSGELWLDRQLTRILGARVGDLVDTRALVGLFAAVMAAVGIWIVVGPAPRSQFRDGMGPPPTSTPAPPTPTTR